jgi:hypothetical protein
MYASQKGLKSMYASQKGPQKYVWVSQAVTAVNHNLATAAQREVVRRLAMPCVPASDPAGVVVVVAKAVEFG